MLQEMTRLSLTTCKRKQRRQTLILIWWNQVITIVSWLVISLYYMLVVKYKIDKPRVPLHEWAAKWQHKRRLTFRKGRAQGNRAKSDFEMEQEQQVDHDFDEVSHNERTNTSFEVEETSSVRSKKRKSASQDKSLFRSFNDAVILFADALKESSAKLSEGIKYELDLKKKTQMITFEVSKMTSLTQLERFRAIEKLKNDRDSVITFWALNEEEREDWVRFLLSE
ncbi:hypothetical protein L1987_35743 [Smallanthus sonchifolius]|uniref:Uncharacterized protein n=1 Tax=Smallanthus sonchifolius TaxID=185202 RepID=A0ACB9HBP0_9ASTR|nr:hypothetical protein L1987_35743 [Smallanthus sonchifolius]